MEGVRWAVCCSKWQPTREQWIRAGQCVQLDEKLRINKFYFQRDAKSAMVGRLLLRKGIAQLTRIPYSEIKLGRTAKGKPFVENLPPSLPNFSANVSHQGSYAVLAAETNFNVGVDVMRISLPRGKTVEKFLGTFRKLLTESEWQTVMSAGTEWKQLANFYRIWCLKESYVKALGVGLGRNLRLLGFTTASPVSPERGVTTDTRLHDDGKPVSDWLFEESMLDESHSVAVAKRISEPQVASTRTTVAPPMTFTALTVEDLLEGATACSEADDSFWLNFDKKPAD